MTTKSITVFAGPSAYGLSPRLRRAADHWAPPARRGDVDRLVNTMQPGVLVLCDGVFDAVPAVSHAELCRALDGGWQVWGVASMGAIRAWELRGEGMRGYGHVYAMFARLADFTDDEMCLLHLPEEPYFPVTEALVNVRVALDEYRGSCGIDECAATHLVRRLGALWFGERSEALIRRILVDESHVAPADADRWLQLMRGNRIKNRDLEELLAAQPWLPAIKG